jgi:NAD(P)-dependent dehydrogenase (short-subunit alcohol dehydrogenase family)
MKQTPVISYGVTLGVALIARGLVRHLRAYELRGKVALVTGGSRGLGLVIARELVARGARVAICARQHDELVRATAELAEHGGTVLPVVCDLTDPAAIANLVSVVTQQLGPIDVLINNAGVIQVGPMELMTPTDYAEAMATHFWAPLQLIQAVAPSMIERRTGRIVNITSIGGKIAVPHLLPYTASKFALVGLSESLHIELARHGVCVTTVVPGLMRTGSDRNARFKGKHRDEHAWFAIADSLRLTSMSVERAARQIVNAIRHGEPEIILSIQAKIATRLYALAPRVAQHVLALVDRMLPRPGGIGSASAPGHASESAIAPSILTRASARAAVRNNEVQPDPANPDLDRHTD